MNLMWWLTFSAGWVLAVLWLIRSIKIVQFMNQGKLSTLASQLGSPVYWPKVSVIIPARNEEQKIRDCLISIAKLVYPELEIVCVNDRSHDSTGRIMDEMAVQDKRMKVIHVQELPEGWLGKTHAMMLGAKVATGEFLVFSDADVIYHSKVITHAIRYTIAKKIDHLSLYPKFVSDQFWKSVFTTYMSYAFSLVIRPESIPDSSSNAYAGIGPFNLVKKDVYNTVSGVEKMRLDILEDMKLGWLIKISGYRSELLLANDLLYFEWHKGLRGVIRGVEKNLYASMNFSLIQVVFTSIITCTILFMLYGAIFLLDDVRVSGYIFAFLVVHISYGYYVIKTEKRWGITWTFPVAVLLSLYALWRSVVITHIQGGVRWRDSFYSLKLLREYNARVIK